MGGSNFKLPPSAWQGTINGFVVNATWADLQPTQSGPITSNNIIDRALAAASNTNDQIKIRIWAGEDAPDWAKALDGGPLPTLNGAGIGLWWKPDYEAAYAALQTQLSALYDGSPYINNVTISGCMTRFDEPLRRDDVDSGTPLSALLAAGYTNAQDVQCQQASMQAHTVWLRTHQSFAFNPYVGLSPAGQDEATTESLMDYCAQTLGLRCSLENNSIQYPALKGFYTSMYAHMITVQGRYGLAVDLQTAVLSTSPRKTAATLISPTRKAALWEGSE